MANHIPRFKAGNQNEGKHSVVGDCNGHSCEERWEKETPAFARAILSHLPADSYTVLDYGCGIGRLAKEILKQNTKVTVLGLDASSDELALAEEYVSDSRFIPILPEELEQKVDLVYCIYVLQHVPAVELRHAIERMFHFLKPGGKLVYCSSDYRMAINAHGGFSDDSALGVDIRRELSRLFEEDAELFNLKREDPIIKDMVTAEGCPPGSIPHPAKVYRKRKIELDADQPYFKVSFPVETTPGVASGGARDAQAPVSARAGAGDAKAPAKRLILQNRLAPGDILVMTAAIRALHKAHPGRFITDVESPCADIFTHNPYITSLNGDGQKIDMHYPLISDHRARGFVHPGAGASGRHFSDGHRKFLEEVLEIEIPRAGLTPELYLSQDERLWPSPALKEGGLAGRYWAINAGSKGDYTLKQYHAYQRVVDLLRGKVQFVQIGAAEHNHAALDGVVDLRGKTGHRELYRTIFHADGVLTCVSYPMHIAAAFGKPCVVVAGGRESTRWELYPNHRFLYTNGALPCCAYDGCWKSKIEECAAPVPAGETTPGKGGEVSVGMVPKCMTLIKPETVADAIMMYYAGGMLEPIEQEEMA